MLFVDFKNTIKVKVIIPIKVHDKSPYTFLLPPPLLLLYILELQLHKTKETIT